VAEEEHEQEQEFMIFVRPRLSVEELAALSRREEPKASLSISAEDEEDPTFISPMIPGRMRRGASTPEGE